MTHAHDDIRVGTVCLPFIGNGWSWLSAFLLALTLQYQDPVGSNQNEPKTNIFRLKLRSLPSNAG